MPGQEIAEYLAASDESLAAVIIRTVLVLAPTLQRELVEHSVPRTQTSVIKTIAAQRAHHIPIARDSVAGVETEVFAAKRAFINTQERA